MEMASIYEVVHQTGEGDGREPLWKDSVWSTSIQIREASKRMREQGLAEK